MMSEAPLLLDDSAAPGAGGALQEYAADFDRLHARAQAQLQALKAAGDGKWEDELRAAQRAVEEMDSTRRQVQVQLRLELSGAGDVRQEWERRLQEWSRALSGLRGNIDSAREERSRGALGLAGGSASAERALEGARARQSTELLHQSSRRLEEAKRQALETESIGEGVLSDLAAQRESIQHVRDNMGTVADELTAARRSLDRMLRSAQQSQVLTQMVAAFMAIGLAIWGLLAVGVPLKWTCVIAILVIVAGALALELRRRLKANSAREVVAAEFHRAPA